MASIKKAAKRSAKKAAKKAISKKVARKSVKKAVPKKIAKKSIKKTAPKKGVKKEAFASESVTYTAICKSEGNKILGSSKSKQAAIKMAKDHKVGAAKYHTTDVTVGN